MAYLIGAAIASVAGDLVLALACYTTQNVLPGIVRIASTVLVGLSAGRVWRGSVAAAEIIGAGTGQRLGGLLRHRRCALPHVQAQLLYSLRSPDDVFYRDELGEETTLTFTR